MANRMRGVTHELEVPLRINYNLLQRQQTALMNAVNGKVLTDEERDLLRGLEHLNSEILYQFEQQIG